jgi:hypothetical protein
LGVFKSWNEYKYNLRNIYNEIADSKIENEEEGSVL